MSAQIPLLIAVVAAFLLAYSLAMAAEEKCVTGLTAEPPFLVSDNFMMGGKDYENFRSLGQLGRVQAHIPKRTLVRALPQERQKFLTASRDGRYIGVEVLGMPKGGQKAKSGLAEPLPGETGFIHYKSLVRPSPGTQLPKTNSKYHFDPDREGGYVFEVKADSPFFPMIDDGKVRGGEFLRLTTVGEAGQQKFKFEDCCEMSADGAKTDKCRIKYFFTVFSPGDMYGETEREVSFDMSGACSIANALEAKTMTEIRDIRNVVQKYMAKPPAATVLPPVTALGANARRAEPLSTRVIRIPTPAPPAAQPAVVRAPPKKPTLTPPAQPTPVPSAEIAAHMRTLISNAGPRPIRDCSRCPFKATVPLVAATISPAIQSGYYNYHPGPFGSVHYYLGGQQVDTNTAQSAPMCSFLVVLRENHKNCRGETGSGCTVIWGDFYALAYHNSHGTGECVDMHPMYKTAPRPGNYSGGHSQWSGNYDREATKRFIELARANGAKDIRFCDAQIPGIVQDCRRHRDHIHMCFRANDGGLPPECTKRAPGSGQIMVQGWGNSSYGLDACYL